MATAECRFGGGLNSSSGGELKLYLKWKRNTHFPVSTEHLKSKFSVHSYTFYNLEMAITP